MPRSTHKAELEQRQDASQPYLFDDSQLPVCLGVLTSIRDGRYEHKGERLLEDDARALRLVELLLARWGVKKIAREMQISPHTVRAAKRALVVQGKLAPYKQRVVEMMEDAIEAGIANYRDALEDGRIQPGQIPVGIGILADKRAVALGEPTSISATAATADAEKLSVENLNAYVTKLRSANVPSDSQSTDNPQKPQ